MTPLRIGLAIESWGPGGAEKMVLQLAAALRERGHTVFPVMPRREDSWLASEFRASGFKPTYLSPRRAFDPGLIVDLARFCRSAGLDVFHAHEFAFSVYGVAAASFARCAAVSTMHGGTAFASARRRRVALRWALRRADAAVAVSRSARDFLSQTCHIPANRVKVVPNGISFRPGSRSAIRTELGVNDSETLIVAVGNLYPVKGHAFLLEGLARLKPDYKWRLAIAGRGNEEPRLRDIATRGQISDRVNLLGVRNDIADLLAAADVFVMPSLSEGLPMALLEAMFAGKPIIASSVGGIPDVVRNGATGLLVPPADAEALAAALTRMLTDPTLRRSLGDAASVEAPSRFSIEHMVDAYVEIYTAARAEQT